MSALTAADREAAIERALSHVQNDYVRRCVRAAGDVDEAAREAKRQCGQWGSHGGGISINGYYDPRGLIVKAGDREGVVTWREIALHARVGVQGALF